MYIESKTKPWRKGKLPPHVYRLHSKNLPFEDPLSISDKGAGTDTNTPVMDSYEQLVARAREDLEPNKGPQKISANQQVVRLCQRASVQDYAIIWKSFRQAPVGLTT
jgi:hypothetical protein